MNKKNTILITVMINSGLLAVLLIAALTTQEDVKPDTPVLSEAPHSLPVFDDHSLFQEVAGFPVEKKPILEIPVTEPVEPIVHKLPPMAATQAPVESPVLPKPEKSIPSLTEVSVKKGDTLEKIARVHRTTVNELIKINHLPSSFLKVGQVLKIPAEKVVIASAPQNKPAESNPEYYTIKVGENPWAIAMKHHMKVEELLRLNGLNEEKARKLKAGDRLRIR
jgi:peptidoglycan endopeptidase LytF